MFSRKTDRVSRIVAFITAFAIAMLTVTLIHRTIVYADELPGEAYDVPNGYEEGELTDTETEITVETAPDNPLEEEVSDDIDGNAAPEDDGGVATYAEVMGITPGKKEVKGNGVIFANEYGTEIRRKGQQEAIKAGETVQNGDALEFYLYWNIPNTDKDTYENSYFKYEITEKELNGVSIFPMQDTYWVDGNNGERIEKAYYEIRIENGRTIMYIEPRNGFYSSDRSGTIRLDGAVNLSGYDSSATDVTLKFFTANVNVKAPSLDNSIIPHKSCGQLVSRGGEYYQKYKIELKNPSLLATSAATVLDIPGNALTGAPIDPKITIGNGSWEEGYYQGPITATYDEATHGYTFSVEPIRAGGVAYIEYEMEVVTTEVLDPSINSYNNNGSADLLKNTVTVGDKTVDAYFDPSPVRPQVEKTGVLDKDKNIITWTIKIHSNGMGNDANFSVTDVTDIPGIDTANWTNNDFDFKDGVWVKTYETPLTGNINNDQKLTNKAIVKYDGYDYEYEKEAFVIYKYDDNFVTKECTGLEGDTIGWKVTVDVPYHNGDVVSSIVISDSEQSGKKYNGGYAYSSVLDYDLDSIEITVDGGVPQKAKDVGATFGWTNTHMGSFELTINNDDYNFKYEDNQKGKDFLKGIAGKTITISYRTSIAPNISCEGNVIYEQTDIDLLGICKNKAECTVTYQTDTGKDFRYNYDEAEYKADFVLQKYTGQNKGEVGAATLREPLYWVFMINDFANVNDKNEITFTDTLPTGYTFLLNDEAQDNPEYYVKCVLSGEQWSDTADAPVINGDFTFEKNYTVMNGTIRLTNEEVNKLANGHTLRVTYFTQMTKAYYANFNTLGTSKDFKNTVSVKIGNLVKASDYSQTKIPQNKNIVNKTAAESDNFINDGIVTYTINVNSEAVHLGDENNTTDKLILTDTLGTYLRLKDVNITPSDGTSYDYNESTKKLTVTLKNDTAYTITYQAEVTKRLNDDEYIDNDKVDDDARDKAIIDMLYGNTAELTIPDGSKISDHVTLKSQTYRSRVSIQSKLINEDDDDMDDENNKMYLKIKKQWDDKNNPYKDANGKVEHNDFVQVTVQKFYKQSGLLANENSITLDIHKYNDEYYKIANFPLPLKDKAGNEYVYKVVNENNVPVGYEWEASEMTKATGSDVIMKDGAPLNTYVITVTNTYNDNIEKTKITVTKDWSGDDSNTKNRSTSIGYSITQNGTEIEKGTLSEENKWTASFDVPKYDGKGKEYKYKVSETTKNTYYKPVVTSADNSDGTAFTITNKYLGQTEIKVTKKWEGDEDYTYLRNGSVKFNVYQEDQSGNKVLYKTGTLSDANKWTDSVKVPEFIDADHTERYVYTVEEKIDNNYYDSAISNNGNNFIIKNTLKLPELTKIKVKKDWAGDKGHEDLRRDSVDFSIVQNNRVGRFYELNKGNGWTQNLTLLKYSNLAGTEMLNDYYVTETTNDPNYASSVTKSDESDGTMLFTITNTFKPISITITKNWIGEDDSANRPDSVTVTLLQDGVPYVENIIIKADNQWKYTVKDLPQYDKDGNLYSYTISEESVDGYTLESITDPIAENNYKASVTNKYTPVKDKSEKIKLTVTKQWSDAGYEYKRTAVEFDLYQNNEKYDTYTIPKAGKTGSSWKYTIPVELPKYNDDGTLCSYTVKEVSQIAGYTSSTTQNPTEKNGYNAVISNKYIPPATINVSISKHWDDKGYEYKRPDVTFKLIQKVNGIESDDSITIYAEENIGNDVWTYTFKNLPLEDEEGNNISYRVEEESIEGYECDVKSNGNSWAFTNTYKVPKDPDEDDPDDPNKPGSDDPNKPGSDDPNKPGSDDPNKPGSDDPNKPGSDDPNKPGSDDPNKPGSNDPNKPGSEDPNKPNTGTEPTPGTEPIYPPPVEDPVYPVYPAYPVYPLPIDPDNYVTEPEDVSSGAGFFDEDFDPVRRDDIMIFILVGIIITGTLILVFRHNSDKSDGKYHM